MEQILIHSIAKKLLINPNTLLIFRKNGEDLKQFIFSEYKLEGNILLLNFTGIESITGSVIDEIILKEYENKPQQKSSKFLGAFVVTNLEKEVIESLENEFLARMKRKDKSNEFILYLDEKQKTWRLIPDQDDSPFLEPKLKEVLQIIMEKKKTTSTQLVEILKNKEEISTKNARIRLEKLFNFRLVNKVKGDGKEYIYQSLF